MKLAVVSAIFSIIVTSPAFACSGGQAKSLADAAFAEKGCVAVDVSGEKSSMLGMGSKKYYVVSLSCHGFVGRRYAYVPVNAKGGCEAAQSSGSSWPSLGLISADESAVVDGGYSDEGQEI